MVQYYRYPISVICHIEHHLHSTLCRANKENRDAYIHLIGILSLVHMSKPRFCPQWRFIQESSHLLFRNGPTRPVQLYSGAIVAPLKFHGVSNVLKVLCNPECRAECGAQFCDILRLLLLIHAQSISDQYPTGKQGVELCCSPCGVVLYGGYPEQHPCLPGTF